jgi:hypothetical protein
VNTDSLYVRLLMSVMVCRGAVATTVADQPVRTGGAAFADGTLTMIMLNAALAPPGDASGRCRCSIDPTPGDRVTEHHQPAGDATLMPDKQGLGQARSRGD